MELEIIFREEFYKEIEKAAKYEGKSVEDFIADAVSKHFKEVKTIYA